MLTDGLAGVVDLLGCPRCRQRLTASASQLRCPDGHGYDLARQGYVNLLAARPPAHADTATMVAARAAFLTAGHYDPLITALPIDRAAEVIIDAGAGPGCFLAGVLDRTSAARGLAIDISVPACRRAARAHLRVGAAVADTWRGLPVLDGVADTIMVVFAPRNFAEFDRMITPTGRLIILTPEPDHLHELVRDLGLMTVDRDKTERLRRDADPWFEITRRTTIRFTVRLTGSELEQVVLMGPNAFHLDASRIADQLDRARHESVTVSCAITELSPRRGC